MFSWFTKSGVLEEEFLQRDMDAIQGFLVNQGYLDTVVEYPTVDYEADGIIVNFSIQQGTRYKLGNVSFAGDLLEDEASLYERIALDELKAKNEYFSLSTMQDDIKDLKEAYNDYGFAFAEVIADTPVNRTTGTVDVIYQLLPKEKVFIRNIFIEGNTETRDNVILRELRIADGQQYDGAKLRRSIERLYKLQFFEDVNIDIIPTGTAGEVDLKVLVKESSTGSISMGVGYSTYDDIGVSAGINQRNLFGRGYNLGVNGYVSGKTLSMRGSFINPRINDTNLGFIASVYAEDEEWPDYDKRTVGTQWGLTYPLGEYTTISGAYRLEFYELKDVAYDASTAIKSYDGNNIASVVSVGIARDTTNHPLAPTRGTKQSIHFEYGGGFLGGSDDFYKVTGNYGFYVGFNDDHVLHARGTLGAVFENGNSPIPAFERFYIGGINSLRGYDYEDISPQDLRTGESIGGTRVGYGSLEYIWRVNKEFNIFLVPFFDFGTSFDHDYTDWDDTTYYSTGLELRWNSPFGALRFAYGVPLTDDVMGRKLNGRFEFSMGSSF
jgi:outer membrane protein insertion porin family